VLIILKSKHKNYHQLSHLDYFTSDAGGLIDQKNIIKPSGMIQMIAAITNI
jgi:hypothetical protein